MCLDETERNLKQALFIIKLHYIFRNMLHKSGKNKTWCVINVSLNSIVVNERVGVSLNFYINILIDP